MGHRALDVGVAMVGNPPSEVGARVSGAGRRRVAAAIGVSLSALAFSGVYAVVQNSPADESSLSVRVELQLEAARAMRELSVLLEDSTPLGDWRDGIPFGFRRGTDSFSM